MNVSFFKTLNLHLKFTSWFVHSLKHPKYDPEKSFLADHDYSDWYERYDKKYELIDTTPKELVDISPIKSRKDYEIGDVIKVIEEKGWKF